MPLRQRGTAPLLAYILSHYSQIFFFRERECSVGDTWLCKATTEMQHVNTNILKQKLGSEGEGECYIVVFHFLSFAIRIKAR